MHLLPESANKLIDEFSRLPGIGKKTAQRLTFYLLNSNQEYVHGLSQALRDIKVKIQKCSLCHGITENDPCMICKNTERDENMLCVVESAYDIFVFEIEQILDKASPLKPFDFRVNKSSNEFNFEVEWLKKHIFKLFKFIPSPSSLTCISVLP